MGHSTRIDLDSSTRAKVTPILQQSLWDTLDLFTQCKQAHWNVRGPAFLQLHELFDTLSDQVEEAADELAERAAALGAEVSGTARDAAKGSKLKEYPAGIKDGPDHVDALADAFARYAKTTRANIDATAKLGDLATSDLFTGLARETDKALWLLEAHLQAKR